MPFNPAQPYATRCGYRAEILRVLPKPTWYRESIAALVHSSIGPRFMTFDSEGRRITGVARKPGPTPFDLVNIPSTTTCVVCGATVADAAEHCHVDPVSNCSGMYESREASNA